MSSQRSAMAAVTAPALVEGPINPDWGQFSDRTASAWFGGN